MGLNPNLGKYSERELRLFKALEAQQVEHETRIPKEVEELRTTPGRSKEGESYGNAYTAWKQAFGAWRDYDESWNQKYGPKKGPIASAGSMYSKWTEAKSAGETTSSTTSKGGKGRKGKGRRRRGKGG